MPDPFPSHEEPSGPWMIYVCPECGRQRGYFESPTCQHWDPERYIEMLPVEVVPVQQLPERGAEDTAIRRELWAALKGYDAQYGKVPIEDQHPLPRGAVERIGGVVEAARMALARLDTKGERDAG